jgi:drug/metabolite transporter (DMT)-like permease
VGARLSTLLMTVTPPVAAALAWVFLDEPLGAWTITGIAVTLLGIAWVVMERPEPARLGAETTPAGQRRVKAPGYKFGLTFGALAGVCQAVGLILSKRGMGHTRLDASAHLDPWSATLVRVTFGAAAICALAVIHRAGFSAIVRGAPIPATRRNGNRLPANREIGTALAMLSIGAILGPVTGVWLSLVAIDRADAAIAATLMAMTPVLILPFAAWLERDRISWRAIMGAAVAVLGVAILTLGPPHR